MVEVLGMKKLNYTPGPWEIKGPSKNANPTRCNDYAIIKDGFIIAETFYQVDTNEFRNSEANAQLMAAAPEMLKCLIDADKLICDLCVRLNPHHKECNFCDEREYRIKIIEKATGLKIEEVL